MTDLLLDGDPTVQETGDGDDDEAERRAFELMRHLSEVETEAARQRAAPEVRTGVALVREYEQWRGEGPLVA
jgi:hypothetical protein